MATDALNIQLLHKVLFYRDGLEIQNSEASISKASTDNGFVQATSTDKKPKQKEVAARSPSMEKIVAMSAIDRFSYSLLRVLVVGGLQGQSSDYQSETTYRRGNVNTDAAPPCTLQ